MAASTVPATIDQITPQWLSHVLRGEGLLENANVVGLEREVLGEGQGFIGDVIRLKLELDSDEPSAPKSLIVKLPTTTSRKNRGFAQVSRIYEKEICFYRELAHRIGARAPRHYYSALDETPGAEQAEATSRFIDTHLPMWLVRLLVAFFSWLSGFNFQHYVLLMEDVAPAEVGNQVNGCSAEDAALAVRTLAAIHAEFWNSEELTERWWIYGADAVVNSTMNYYDRCLDAFIEKQGSRLTLTARKQLQWLSEHGKAALAASGGPPFTLLHSDYRLDNLFFDRERGDVIVGDWQTPLHGLPGLDVAYFFSGTLATDSTESDEQALLDEYHSELHQRGITDYTREDLQHDYGLGLLLTLQRLVLMEMGLVDVDGDRGEELTTGWIERTIHLLDRIDVDTLLKERGG